MSPSALQETKELTTNADQSNIERFQTETQKTKTTKTSSSLFRQLLDSIQREDMSRKQQPRIYL
jgi:hypothetical protein